MAAVVSRPASLAKRKESKFELDLRKFKDGSAGSEINQVFYAVNIVDNTAFAMLTVVVPNFTLGATIGILLSTMCGDGDAVQSNYYTVSISRIAAAALAVTVGSATNSTSVGATASTITLAAGSTTGANSVTQSFPLNVTVARSGGSSLTHFATMQIQLLNNAQGTQSNTTQGPGGIYIQ